MAAIDIDEAEAAAMIIRSKYSKDSIDCEFERDLEHHKRDDEMTATGAKRKSW